MPLLRRLQEGGLARCVAEVHGGSSLEKKLDQGAVAAVGSGHERGPVVLRLEIAIGAAREKEARDLEVPAGRRENQRRPAEVVALVDGDAARNEVLDQLTVSVHGGFEKGSKPVGVPRLEIGAGFEEQVHHCRFSDRARDEDRGCAVEASRVDGGAGIEKTPRDLEVRRLGRKHEGTGSITVRGIRRDTALEKELHHVDFGIP